MSKRAIRPTRRQKELIRRKRLIPDNWLVVNENDGYLTLVHKETKRQRTIEI